MKVVLLFVFLSTVGFLLLGAVPSHAQDRPVDRPTITVQTNERGFTLGDMFDNRLWALAPLSAAMMSQLGDSVHQAPKRGVEFELLTPGDVGCTLHFYW